MSALVGLLGLYVGFLAGWYGRLALKALAQIQAQTKPREVRSGVTRGSYDSPAIPKRQTAAVVTPKTPQQVQLDAELAAKRGYE